MSLDLVIDQSTPPVIAAEHLGAHDELAGVKLIELFRQKRLRISMPFLFNLIEDILSGILVALPQFFAVFPVLSISAAAQATREYR